jgi:hypothetical protein
MHRASSRVAVPCRAIAKPLGQYTACLLSALGSVLRARRAAGGPAHEMMGRVTARSPQTRPRVVLTPGTPALSPMPFADRLSYPNVS